MDRILDYSLDFAVFSLVVALGVGFVVWRIAKIGSAGVRQKSMLWAAALIVLLTVTLAYRAGEQDRRRLIQTVIGIAPTYAVELDRIGHREVDLDTPADSAVYLKLIEAEKQWLAANPSVADIYTLRKTPDGSFALCVDSETDYDHNGKYEGEREERTTNGEVYDEADAQKSIQQAFDGTLNFDGAIYSDRWGTWVSANCPVRDDKGNIYAVVGVDFPAQQWVSSILTTRCSLLVIGLVTTGILLTTSYMMAKLQAEVVRRREAELQAVESESRLRTIVENEPEAVLVMNLDGALTELNPSGRRILGGASVQLPGSNINQFLDAAGVSAFREHMLKVVAGQSVSIELQMHSAAPGNPSIWLDLHSVPLADSTGRVTRVLAVGRDVTARKQAEGDKEKLQQQLLVASRQAGMAEVATGVLHNVGNVLNSVNVSARMITEKLKVSRLGSLGKVVGILDAEKDHFADFVAVDPRGKCLPAFLKELHAKLHSDQELIQKETDLLVQGVEHIKEVVRMQQSSATASNVLTQTDPASVMEDAVKINLVSMERHLIHLHREYQPDLPKMMLDKHKILQILINLISNAKKATCHPDVIERHVTLRVLSADDSRSVRFEIQDNGVGIAPESAARMFQHGFSAFKDGHGFGLHSGSNAASEMGGSLTVKSDGPGKGATFVLSVPIEVAKVQEVLA